MTISREALVAFENEYGRMPNTLEMFALREAVASVAIDKGDVGTYSLPEGAYTMTPAQAEERRSRVIVDEFVIPDHEYCGRLSCEDHQGQARYENDLRTEGMLLAMELINEHRHGFGSMHPADEFQEGLECAENVIKLAIIDPLFVPPLYNELSDPNTLLSADESTTGGERD